MRILIIVNSRSGGSDAGLYDFARALGTHGAEMTLRFADGERAIEDLLVDATGFDRVVAAGGDGTASAVCYALRDSGIPVLVYPAGTANLLALNLGMPVEPRALAHTLLEGIALRFDLGEIEQMHPGMDVPLKAGFAIMAGAGFDAALVNAAQPMKSTIGAAAYLVAAMTNLAPTTSEFEMALDGEHMTTDGIGVLLLNFGRLQFDVPVASGADPRDGRLEVAVIRSRSVAGLLPAILAGWSGAERVPGLDLYAAAHVTVSAYPPLRMQYDGEVADALTPFEARVLPGATTLLLPADSPYVR